MSPMQICSLMWMVFVAVWLVAWFKTKRTQERVDFGARLLYGVPVFIGSYLLFSDNVSGWLRQQVIPKNPGLEILAISHRNRNRDSNLGQILHRRQLEQRGQH